mgnify:CR=1 FL=1
MKPTIQQLSIDSKLIAECLMQVEIGQLVTYEVLSEVIRQDATNDHGRGCIATARRMLQRDHQMVFAAVRGVGLKRLSDAEIVQTGSHSVHRVRSAARRGAKMLTAVSDFDALAPADKLRHNAHLSVLGAIEAMTSTGAVKKVESKVTAASPLPIAATLEAFGVKAPA